jgi:hypothetical protein
MTQLTFQFHSIIPTQTSHNGPRSSRTHHRFRIARFFQVTLSILTDTNSWDFDPTVGVLPIATPIIHFEFYTMPGLLPEPVILTAEDPAFSGVIERLLELGVENWKRSYSNPMIMDGYGWSLKVICEKLNIVSSGMNADPPRFDAVKELIEAAAKETTGDQRNWSDRDPTG